MSKPTLTWKCKKCGSWWTYGAGEKELPSSRCYGDCGGAEFEQHEVFSTTASTSKVGGNRE